MPETEAGVGIAKSKTSFAKLGNEHMETLKSLAIKAGIDVPIYTATGWGYAAIIPDGCIPVTAAYAYPTWTKEEELSPFFLYKDMHKNPDYAPVRYKSEDYPVFPAELGSGIESDYKRRPTVVQKSFDAMINRCIGSGANGLGYYMYHGGSTPRGDHHFFSDEAGGLPKISYDFQAPIGEFGQVREGFHRLKIVHYFLNDFGYLLAPMQTVLPANASSLTPENISDLRYAVRIKGNSGFLFLDNFQDHTIPPDKNNILVKIKTPGGDLLIPESGSFNLKSEENAIFPFNFNLNGVVLNCATSQLMTKSDDAKEPWYVFFRHEGVNSEFSFTRTKGLSVQKNSGIKVDKNSKRILVKCKEPVSEFTLIIKGRKTKVLVIDKSVALKSYIAHFNGKKYIIFSNAVVLQYGKSFTILSDGENNYEVSVYPKIKNTPFIDNGTITNTSTGDVMTSFHISIPNLKIPVETSHVGQKKFIVKSPEPLRNLNDIFLQINFTGDTGMGFLDGKLVTDKFYNGIPWQIGLKRFYPDASSKEMVFYFRPMYKNATYLQDLNPFDVPDFKNKNQVLEIRKMTFIPEYKTVLQFK